LRLRLPPLETRSVFVGAYNTISGAVVVLFRKMPTYDETWEDYTLGDDVIGRLWADDVDRWLGSSDGLIKAGILERHESGTLITPDADSCIRKITKIEVTTCWDEDGKMMGLDVNADN
jgi:hypothetical protein